MLPLPELAAEVNEMPYIGLQGGDMNESEARLSTLRYLLAQTTTHAEAMQAALWKLEKMNWWERLWYGRGVVREALRIGRWET